jgi:hypothetical protein
MPCCVERLALLLSLSGWLATLSYFSYNILVALIMLVPTLMFTGVAALSFLALTRVRPRPPVTCPRSPVGTHSWGNKDVMECILDSGI